MIPTAGDIIEIDADVKSPEEGQHRQTVMVVSVKALQASLGLAIVCAMTADTKRPRATYNNLEVTLPTDFAITGDILPHQLRLIDCATRNSEKLGTAPRATLRMIRARLKVLLGL